MIELIKNLLGFGPKINMKELMASGALVIDVRTPAEYKDGHVKGAINLPLQTLGNNLNKLKKDQVIITCCRSGSRSGMAKRMLKANGFEQVHNGGAWTSLKA
ncbi:rhodanese-like domain-containing protein [Aquirufa sp. 2-AUSEE-184A6]|jgi:rhodanese-related sulfurtransferase|uniref:Rhodanese-like domain-containing protein n=1 Tax=Aquirufa novilacunae TaxID=3139305 RepID=A0ABW8SSK1_9BACT